MIPRFANKEDLKGFILTKCNGDKSKLHAMKLATTKQAEAVHYVGDSKAIIKEDVAKAGLLEKDNEQGTTVRAIINTTNILDSHGDVHIPGLWKKSIKENKRFLHLQEHKMTFDNIISQEGSMSTKNVDWASIGYDFEGKTEALIFDSNLSNSGNEKMVQRYKSGEVTNHSVGMRYVKMYPCVNSEDSYWKEEKSSWDKYIDQVANKEEAIADGMFWAVTEAKVVEGSAVVMGSNQATPTLWVKDNEAAKGTSEIEPSIDTQKQTVNILSQIKF